MPSRIAGRLLTGPLAFLAGGVLDVLTYAVRSLRTRLAIRPRH